MPRAPKFSARMLGGAFILLVLPVTIAAASEHHPSRTYLHKNWRIQSACDVKATGEQISSPGFDGQGWHKTDVPATVVGALVADKKYPHPKYGTNLQSFSGMNYSRKKLFGHQEKAQGSPFHLS